MAMTDREWVSRGDGQKGRGESGKVGKRVVRVCVKVEESEGKSAILSEKRRRRHGDEKMTSSL